MVVTAWVWMARIHNRRIACIMLLSSGCARRALARRKSSGQQTPVASIHAVTTKGDTEVARFGGIGVV